MQTFWQTAQRFWQRYARILKLIFITSVILFVVITLGNFFKTVDWGAVSTELTTLPLGKLLLLTLGGLIAILPMTGYDIAITHLLPGKFNLFYIFRSGWITNTLTNVAGFGGLLGATLRAHFYGKQASRSQIIGAIAKIAVFLLAGLSLLCWLALIIMFAFHQGGHFNRYAIWLVSGGLYFPLALWLTHRQEGKLFGEMSLRFKIFVSVTSTFEWLFIAGFFILVGMATGIKTNYWAVFTLYVVAQVLGVVSMLPGAIGSFDVMMLLELSLLGIPRSSAIVWLLLFRVFYYIIPLFLALVFFVHYLFDRVNDFFDHIPAAMIRQGSQIIITIFMYVSGIFMLLAASVPDLTASNRFLQRFYPFTFFFLHQLTTILFAIAMLACARGIQAKVKKAYWPTVILLLIGIINTFINLGTPSLAIYLVVLLVLMFLMRNTIYREKLQYSIGKLIFDGSIYAGSLILYSIVGLVNSPNYAEKHRVPTFFFFQGEKIWLSGFIGMLLGLIIMILIIRYFMRGSDPFGIRQPLATDRVQAIIDEYGGNETCHLAFLGDKNIYYYKADGKDQLFFMYQAKNGRLVVMGDPVGNRDVWHDAVHQFMVDADRFNYQLVFYEVGEEMTLLLHEYGFDFLKTGEDGMVKLADFTLAGKKQRSQRALMHKFDREGYTFEILQPPFDQATMAELKKISDEWLGNQVEKGFSLGYFDPNYLNTAPIGVVKGADGKMVAFATFMPTGGKEILTIDLMRHTKAAPSGIMDKIFISMFEYGQANNYQYFDLGMAPLANVGHSQYAFNAEKIAHFIYEYGSELYSFQGLRRYKEKYASLWRPKYTVYFKQGSLIAAMIAVVAVVNQRVDQATPKPVLDWMLWWKK